VAGSTGAERLLADTGSGPPPRSPSITSNLVRTPGDEPARWVRTHVGDKRPGPSATDDPQYRVRIEVDDVQLGALVGARSREGGDPTRVETRVLALAADQIAVALRRDQLRQTATELEVARQTDVLKTALIDSVSHDFRTPLASIRATAGSLADPELDWPEDAGRAAASVIDAEAARLDRLIGGLLDLSRIASGALHPDLEPHELWAIVEPVVDRMRPSLGARTVTISIPDNLPPVLADAVLFDIVLTNLLDNIVSHTPEDAPVVITAGTQAGAGAGIALAVEDGGRGVPPEQLAAMFERFRRAAPRPEGSRRGLGIGLSVVRGLVEAMGGQVAAAASRSGGLAITVTLRRAPTEPDR
jgi:two-component system sensor histidine kinase KdpD